MSTPSTELLICLAFRNGLIEGLQLDPSQVHIGIMKMRDANWQGKPFYLVVPGAARPDGGGVGAQEGGSLIRTQEFSIHFYGQSKLDQYSQSDSALFSETYGTLNNFEAIRQLFAYTFFGTQDGTATLLSEPAQLSRESMTVWEDADNGIFSREFVFTCQYSLVLPSAITLFYSDVANTPL